MIRLDTQEEDNPLALDDVERALVEMPPLALSLVECHGHKISKMFLSRPKTSSVG